MGENRSWQGVMIGRGMREGREGWNSYERRWGGAGWLGRVGILGREEDWGGRTWGWVRCHCNCPQGFMTTLETLVKKVSAEEAKLAAVFLRDSVTGDSFPWLCWHWYCCCCCCWGDAGVWWWWQVVVVMVLVVSGYMVLAKGDRRLTGDDKVRGDYIVMVMMVRWCVLHARWLNKGWREEEDEGEEEEVLEEGKVWGK